MSYKSFLIAESFLTAARENNLEGLNALLAQETFDMPLMYRALYLAASLGHLSIVRRLVQVDVVANVAAGHNAALCIAAENGHLAVVKCLLKIDTVKQNAAALNNNTLRRAAKNGHLAVVNCLLENDTVRECLVADSNCYNILRVAAKNGHLSVVQRLLQVDAIRKSMAKSRNAVRVLCGVAENGHLSVIQCLLQIDVIRQTVAMWNNSVLCAAIKKGRLAVVKYLLQIDTVRQKVAVSRVLNMAAESGCLSDVQYLLQSAHNKALWRTALCTAAQHGHLADIKRLLSQPGAWDDATIIHNTLHAAAMGHLRARSRATKNEATEKACLQVIEFLLFSAQENRYILSTELCEKFKIIQEVKEKVLNEKRNAFIFFDTAYRKDGSHQELPTEILLSYTGLTTKSPENLGTRAYDFSCKKTDNIKDVVDESASTSSASSSFSLKQNNAEPSRKRCHDENENKPTKRQHL